MKASEKINMLIGSIPLKTTRNVNGIIIGEKTYSDLCQELKRKVKKYKGYKILVR